jgi:hypothetical protein
MKILMFLSLVGLLFTVAGCKPESGNTTPASATTPAGTSASNAQKADDHGHKHAPGEEGHEPHSHGAGPHDGTVVDWGGGKFHVEFTVDHSKEEATVYILGSDEKTPTPIEAAEIELTIKDPAMDVTLKAVPQEGEPAGKSSRFVGNHKSLGVVQEYAGTISGVIEGTPFAGDFKEEPHDH